MDTPVPQPPPSSRPSRSNDRKPGARSRRIRNDLRWGRFWVAVVFVLVAVSYAGAIKFTPPRQVDRHVLMVACVTAVIWDALLLLAIWFRNNWARVVFIGLHVIAVIVFCGVLPTLLMIRPQWPAMVVSKLGACVLLHAISVGLLVSLRWVERLTNRAYQ